MTIFDQSAKDRIRMKLLTQIVESLTLTYGLAMVLDAIAAAAEGDDLRGLLRAASAADREAKREEGRS